MIGKQLLHYRITGKLGEGGMGVVFKAEDTRLKRDVAIKFLPSDAVAGAAQLRRFETEARAAAALNHPNITQVHAIEESDGDAFIVMEYVQGRELRGLVESKELSLERAIALALQIAAGLKAAHDRGIVHRDIKSANIMVTDDGHVKIMDFGLAKVVGNTRVTQSGMVVGTVDYMSPEQVRGEEVDQRADIWSFGVVLYEMLTGERPFRGDYAQAVMYAISNEDAPSPSTVVPNLSAEAVTLTKKLLARNRDDRYASMVDVIGALEGLRKATSRDETKVFHRRKADTKTGLPGVAVLPFTSIRPDPETDYLGFALADQIIGALAYVDSVAVRPSSAVRKYQGQVVDIQAAGRELEADFVLAGHYLKDANAVRLNTELIAIQSNDLVWRESVEVKYDNVFKLQDIVSKKVLRGLKVQFRKSAVSAIQPEVPADPLAYEYYLRAVSYPNMLSDNRLAIEMLEKSIALDPNFASAHAELGYRLAQEANYGLVRGAGYMEAEAAYRRALSRNENLLSALSNLTKLYVEFGRHEEAIELLRRIFQLTPNGADAHFVLSYICRYTGLLGRSIEEVEKALELDPRNPRFRSVGFTYMYAGNYAKAHELFKQHEHSAAPIAWQGWALTLMGERDRAIECFDRAIAMEPDGFVALRFGSMRAFLKGDLEDGSRRIRQLDEELEHRRANDGETFYLMATSCAMLGDRSKSVRWLRSAVEQGFFNYPAMLQDPSLSTMRDDPEFQQVLTLARQKHDKFAAAFAAKML